MSKDGAKLSGPAATHGVDHPPGQEGAAGHDTLTTALFDATPPGHGETTTTTTTALSTMCNSNVGAEVVGAYVGEATQVASAHHINTVTTSGSAAIFTQYDATFTPHECSVQVRMWVCMCGWELW